METGMYTILGNFFSVYMLGMFFPEINFFFFLKTEYM